MSTFKRIEEIESWNLSRNLSNYIWRLSKAGTFAQDESLKKQITRASGSIMDNIAEGFGRGGNREFINFLGYARGSNEEVRSQLYRAYDRGHISLELLDKLQLQSNIISGKLTTLIDYLKKSEKRGSKFHNHANNPKT